MKKISQNIVLTISILIMLHSSLCLADNTLSQTNEDPVPKPWKSKWKSDFTEIIKFPLLGTKTVKGTWYYNSETESFRVDRDDGSRDRYCGLIFPLVKTECRQIVTKDWR
jgi:hypothetical protein